jgi:hypothetical protein
MHAARLSDLEPNTCQACFARHDVVRRLEIPCVDLPRRKEALDLNRTRVLRARERALSSIIVGSAFLRILLVQSAGRRPRTYAGRLGKFHRAGRRAFAAGPLNVAVLDQQKLVLTDLIAPSALLINPPVRP